MNNPHEKPISAQYHFDLDDEVETTPSTETLNFTIKVYLYGEESPTDTYQFQG